MQVTEIFRSIQGESTYAGLPCIFVRLTGCNLRCTWCDTEYSFYGGKKMSIEDVMDAVRAFSDKDGRRVVNLVEVTGGEPLLQKDCIALMEALLAAGYQVMLETSGERYVGDVPVPVVRVIDVKCPGSGEGGTFNTANLEVLRPTDQLKFVLASREDYEYARAFVHQHALHEKVAALIFSPVFGELEAQSLAEWMLEDGLPVRMGLQLHKFIWKPHTQGV
jgi:7-carboxy-7-deazaguanine synthase